MSSASSAAEAKVETRRALLRSACLAAPALLIDCARAQDSTPPNIVFLYTDDQARWSLPCYGSKDAHAPHIERIGREGAIFDRAFVSTPVCSPSRASLLTSQYSFRTGIHDFIDVRREPEVGLPAEYPTWPEMLQRRGYRTGLFGKWHLGTRPEHHPKRRGFHEFMGFLEGGNSPMDPYLEVDGTGRRVSGSLPDLLADAALEFIAKNRANPFLASIHFRAPHAPYGPVPAEDSAVLDGCTPTVPDAGADNKDTVAKQLLAYYRSIASVDRNVGRVLGKLDQLGLSANTVVVFTSDNGYMLGHHGASGKGNGTRIGRGAGVRLPNMFDDSMMTPLLIRWPGIVKPGTRITDMISHLDFFPTLVGIAGARELVPDEFSPSGRDFSALLRGRKVRWRETLYGDYDMYHYLQDSMRMIRTSEWKLVTHSHYDHQHELYDLRSDPGETRNLIGAPEHSATMRRLRRQLYTWQRWVGDPRANDPAKPM